MTARLPAGPRCRRATPCRPSRSCTIPTCSSCCASSATSRCVSRTGRSFLVSGVRPFFPQGGRPATRRRFDAGSVPAALPQSPALSAAGQVRDLALPYRREPGPQRHPRPPRRPPRVGIARRASPGPGRCPCGAPPIARPTALESAEVAAIVRDGIRAQRTPARRAHSARIPRSHLRRDRRPVRHHSRGRQELSSTARAISSAPTCARPRCDRVT